MMYIVFVHFLRIVNFKGLGDAGCEVCRGF